MLPFISLLEQNPHTDFSGKTSLNSPKLIAENTVVRNKYEQALDKSQSCNICGRVLSSPSSYYVHMKVHSDSKPFQCSSCEASFCRKPYLEAHMRTHTGEKPFKCSFCQKSFTQKSSLNTHKRIHTGERPYSCDLCDKRFAVKSYVTAHRWTHIGEKPLTCSFCNLNFTSKHQFAVHIKTHTMSGQNFNCDICNRIYSKEAYLIRHQNRLHKSKVERRNSVDSDGAIYID